ncbi:MAG TPA: PDZ domain-containing protein [Rhizomicrobium sp.]|nr:PDZ domain-containing protein [Rhizomicrobium sp.]
MARLWILVTLGVAASVGGVAYYVTPPTKPRGYAGMEFAVMTPAAAARAPLLTSRGALITKVDEKSPAAGAGIHAGEVVAAIDRTPINSAAQAAGIVRAHRQGDRAVFTLFDEARGDIHSRDIAVTFAAEPPVTKKLSVAPPRTLAKEPFQRPSMAANAAWSKAIARGPTIRPLAMPGLGAGRCNGFAPEYWYVAGHAPDDSMIHVAAPEGFEHAIYQSALLNGRDPEDFVLSLIAQDFETSPIPAPREPQPYGFTLFKFGLPKGAAGFAEYRVTHDEKGGDRIAVWIAAAAAADISWAEPQAGAVAFSLHCQGVDTSGPRPRDPSLATTSVSISCIKGKCGEGDFAAHYMKVLRLGFVHGPDGSNWLVRPQRDFWQDGAEGPGFYHQIGGENEKLEPGRTN